MLQVPPAQHHGQLLSMHLSCAAEQGAVQMGARPDDMAQLEANVLRQQQQQPAAVQSRIPGFVSAGVTQSETDASAAVAAPGESYIC